MKGQQPFTSTYIGGPTALIEWGGLRLLTDPAFDAAGSDYTTAVYTLRKTTDPAIGITDVGHVDAVLLSHDHHFDNLDRSGRAMLKGADHVITTPASAERLGGDDAIGLATWETVAIAAPDGHALTITGTPCRHGPVDGDRGPVTGFLLAFADAPERAIYVSGDTVWYDGGAEVARRFTVGAAVLFLGAARVPAVGPAHLTMTAAEGALAAQSFPGAVILPVHFEGWEHFSEGRHEIEAAFDAAGIADRLRWPEPGVPTAILLT